ncbi:MAG TPA: ATP-binding protein [Chitinophagaceae bacterium]|nr:ATP-binding protein [Chitinophagaceae bacterium]
MKILQHQVFFIIIIFLSNIAFAQTSSINFLKNEIASATSDRQKLTWVLALCEQARNMHPDTLLTYANLAGQIANKLGDKTAATRALYYISFGLTNNGSIDAALTITDIGLKQLQQGNNPVLAGEFYNQKGRCYMRQSEYGEAIDMGYKVISSGEQSGDTLLQMEGKTLIGWAHLEMGRNRESLYWHLQALNTTNDEEFRGRYAILFANLALNYSALGNADSAFYYIDKAVKYSRKYENLFALSNSLAIEAQLYARAGQASLAEEPLKEAVAIRKQIGDPFYIVSDMAQLGIYYANNHQPEKGIAISNEGIALARKYNIDTKLFFLYNTLAENYKAAGDDTSYANTLKKIIELKDSVYQKNSAHALAEMQAKYELQKKENTIIQQEFDLKRKNYLFYGSLFLTLVILSAAYLIFKNNKKQQQMKLDQMREDEKRNSQLAVAEAEEKERRRIAADLHDNLGAYAVSMASNIDFIEMHRGSGAGKDVYVQLRNNSQEIISQLRDTIWVLNKDELCLTAISDRIKLFVNRINPIYPDITINVFEKIRRDLPLSSAEAFHLYRIIQEAVINSLKHGHGTEIIITISSETHWVITVSDNGKGMPGDRQPAPGYGNGIGNMKKRCEEEGWKIEWLSNGPGTTVMINSCA